MKKLFGLCFVIIIIIFYSKSQIRAQNEGEVVETTQSDNYVEESYKRTALKAVVRNVKDINCADETDETKSCLEIDLEIEDGKLVTVELDKRVDVLASTWNLSNGTKVMLNRFEIGDKVDYQIADIYRTNAVLIFLLIYIVVVLVVGRLQGAGSLIGLALSSFVLIKIIIPMTLNGWDPVMVSLIGGFAVLLPSIYFSHGFNRKTTIALIGTTLGLIVTAILSAISISVAHLTGFGAEESLYLSSMSNDLDMGGILLASMIIGGIGLIDDVTVGQVAVIREIYLENRSITLAKLYKKAMNVGKDHIASMVNTLFLAYAAASLPLVMLLVDQGAKLSEIVNIETFSEEIIRTLVASTGLVLTVPITTMFAASVYVKKGIKSDLSRMNRFDNNKKIY